MTTASQPGVRSWRVWLLAARPATLTAGVVPVLVGTAAASHDGHGKALPFLAALAAAVLIQIGTNLANDVFDFERGADSEDRLGPPRATQSGLATPRQMRIAMAAVFAAAALVGLYLVFVGGWPILIIGVLSILAGIAYTGGPWPLGYHGLGDVFVFVFFGLVAAIGSYYLQTEEVTWLAVTTALPAGMTVTAILVVNNLRDIETDRRVGKRTLAVRIGPLLTRAQYVVLVLGAFALLSAVQLAGANWWVALPWLAAPFALYLATAVWRGAEGRALNPLLQRTAQFHLAFGSLLALGLVL